MHLFIDFLPANGIIVCSSRWLARCLRSRIAPDAQFYLRPVCRSVFAEDVDESGVARFMADK